MNTSYTDEDFREVICNSCDALDLPLSGFLSWVNQCFTDGMQEQVCVDYGADS